MRRTKEQKAITLIALIITIVVLLVLAVVAVISIQNDGIISKAEAATNKYNEAVANEQGILQGYLNYLDPNNGGGSGNGNNPGTMKLAEAQTKGILNASANTNVEDEYGNVIVVPAGFAVTTDASNATQGIVITDEIDSEGNSIGNEFVWVPVGTVYTSANKATSETITLSRYTFNEETGAATPVGDVTIDEYFQELATSEYNNATARNLDNFLTSATQKGGYYIGRYEAGAVYDEEGNPGELLCKYGQTVYASITQPDASTLCRNMYNNGADGYATGTFSSDLINSYAWDTAIVFIQTFSTEEDADTYSILNKSTSRTVTGANGDEYCNINDMSGNYREWTTEAYSDAGHPGVVRGGWYNTASYSSAVYRTCSRDTIGISSSDLDSFRPLLYVAL